MKILFLDDMETRHLAFEQCAIGHVVYHAYTAMEAIGLLGRMTFDAAALDHDLRPEHYEGQAIAERGACADDETTGRSVARWIAEHRTPKRVLVHSMNPVGSVEMMRILEDADIRVVRAPFGPEGCRAWLEGWGA